LRNENTPVRLEGGLTKKGRSPEKRGDKNRGARRKAHPKERETRISGNKEESGIGKVNYTFCRQIEIGTRMTEED